MLVEAVHQIFYGGSDYDYRNWFGRLDAILDGKGLKDKEPFEAAQRILDNPVARGLQGVGQLLEVTNDREYE